MKNAGFRAYATINYKNTVLALLMMVMLAGGHARAQGPVKRSDFKRDFPNLIAGVETSPARAIDLSNAHINTESESYEVADCVVDTMINTLLKKNYILRAMRPGTPAYRDAVRREMTRPTVGLHCMNSAYTGIMRGLNDLGVEPEIVSPDAKDACKAFREDMSAKYGGPDFAGGVRDNATIYKNYGDYMDALDKFIAVKTATDKNADPDSLATSFAQKNVCIDDLDRGCVFLMPRGRGQFHAVTYIGRGFLDGDRRFVPSDDGNPMYVSFNRESIQDLFAGTTVKMPFIFNTCEIVAKSVCKECDEIIKKMNKEELIGYLLDNGHGAPGIMKWLGSLNYATLLNMALSRFFGKDFSKIPATLPIEVMQTKRGMIR